jgi:hypothetical protein
MAVAIPFSDEYLADRIDTSSGPHDFKARMESRLAMIDEATRASAKAAIAAQDNSGAGPSNQEQNQDGIFAALHNLCERIAKNEGAWRQHAIAEPDLLKDDGPLKRGLIKTVLIYRTREKLFRVGFELKSGEVVALVTVRLVIKEFSEANRMFDRFEKEWGIDGAQLTARMSLVT